MQVTKNEKFLLVILAAILFAGGNFYGYRWLTQKQTSLQLAAVQSEADQAEANVALQDTDKFTKRKAWITSNQPTLTDEGDAKAQVLDFVEKGIRANKLDLTDQQFLEVEHGPGGARISVSVKVKGSMQDLCKWLADLEKPDQFYAISTFSLKADQDQKSMVCTLHIARYFKEKGGA